MAKTPKLPTMVPVDSSNIEAIGFDLENKDLYIKFHTTRIYKYNPVTHEGFLAFLNAPSIGKYFFANIKNNPTISYVQL